MKKRSVKPVNRQKIGAIKRYRAVKISRLILKCYYLIKRDKTEQVYSLIGDELLNLGGVYIKFLQNLILQNDSFHKYWNNPKKLTVFEDLDFEPLDVEAILINELGSTKAKRIKAVSGQPFAAGSFGQVYSAQLNNKPVIIKILRPQVNELLKFDLRLLRYLWIASNKYINKISSLDLNPNFSEFAKQTMSEIDYEAEVEFANEQYKIYKNHKFLNIPKTHVNYCTDQIIVQEYVGGISAAYLIKLHQQGVDVKNYVKKELNSDLIKQLQTVAYEIIWGSFKYPRIIGDAHPGNIRLMKDNQVSLIDFGIHATCPKSHQKPAFFHFVREYSILMKGEINPGRLFISSLRYFGNDLYRSLNKLSKLSNQKINFNDKLSKIAEANFDLHFDKSELVRLSNNPKALFLFSKLINRDNQFGLKTKIEDLSFVRANLAFNSILSGLGIHQSVLSEVFERAIVDVSKAHPEYQTTADKDISHSDAIDIVCSWLERIANRNPALFRDLVQQLKLYSKDKNGLKLVNKPK